VLLGAAKTLFMRTAAWPTMPAGGCTARCGDRCGSPLRPGTGVTRGIQRAYSMPLPQGEGTVTSAAARSKCLPCRGVQEEMPTTSATSPALSGRPAKASSGSLIALGRRRTNPNCAGSRAARPDRDAGRRAGQQRPRGCAADSALDQERLDDVSIASRGSDSAAAMVSTPTARRRNSSRCGEG